MKILMIVPSFPKLSETFIYAKYQHLPKENLDVHILASHIHHKNPMANTLSHENPLRFNKNVHRTVPVSPIAMVPAYFLGFTLLCFLLRPIATLNYLKMTWSLFGLSSLKLFYLDTSFLLINPDILHFEFGALAAGKMYLKDALKKKIIVSFRGYDINYVGLETAGYYRQVWEKADALHFLGEQLWQRALQRGCPQWVKRYSISPAVDTDFFFPKAEIREPHNPVRILSVGRLEWKKGFEFSLMACRILKENSIDFQYDIAGNGSHLECLALTRHQLELEEDVRFLLDLSSTEVKKKLDWADIFLLPSVSEGFSNSVIEAQAMALPVICSDADGLSENVENEVTGIVVPRRNALALAKAIMRLVSNKGLAVQFGKAGRKRALELFTLQSQMKRLASMYAEV